MKRRVCCSLLCTLAEYLLVSYLNFVCLPYLDIMFPIILYSAFITFIVSFISYGMGEKSNNKQD